MANQIKCVYENMSYLPMPDIGVYLLMIALFMLQNTPFLTDLRVGSRLYNMLVQRFMHNMQLIRNGC